MQRVIQAVIRHGEEWGYVGECSQLNAVTQGTTLDEVASNLQEVIALALEDFDFEEAGLSPAPVIVVTFELEPAVA